jgi:hypothetical protein
MKQLLILLICSSTWGIHLSAQSENIDSDSIFYGNSIGVSAQFINNFLPLDNPIGFGNPYPLHYIKHKCEHRFVKQSIDFNIFGSFENNDDENNVNTIRLFPEYKVAWGRKVPSFKNARFYIGPELLLNPDLNIVKTDNLNFENEVLTDIDQNIELGMFVGPMVGFEYRFSERFSIYTETGYYIGLSYNHRTLKRKEAEETEILDIERTIEVSTLLRFPSSLILFYHF